MFAQSDDAVRDYVFPLLLAEKDAAGGHSYRALLGTGFFIGSKGYALTAAHVAQKVIDLYGDAQSGVVGAFITDEGQWWTVQAMEAECHPSEDVAILRMDDTQQSWKPSIVDLAGSDVRSSSHYMQWAYPLDVMYDIVEQGHAKPRPDLVYFEGYVRRRMTGIPLPGLRGTMFHEVSTVAGPGASGSPLMHYPTGADPRWAVIGVYVGERETDGGVQVGYVAREDEVRYWQPGLVGGVALHQIP
jgi:hypothetical protein